MQVIVILAGSLILVGGLLYLHHRMTAKDTTVSQSGEEKESQNSISADEQCCGMHITCEKDSLSPVFDEEILYFDDEELDKYADFENKDFSEEDIELFRDIMLTLKQDEIGAWARSIQKRGITLPDSVREELLLIVSEMR